MSNVQVVTSTEFPSKSRTTFIDLAFDMLIDQWFEPFRITIVNIMEMHTISGFGYLGIGRRILRCSKQILLQTLFTIRTSKIEVQDNMVLRNPDPMQLRGIDVLQCGGDVIPPLQWTTNIIGSCILSRIVSSKCVEFRLCGVEFQRLDLMNIRLVF